MSETVIPAKFAPLVREKDKLLAENEGITKVIEEYTEKRDSNRKRIADLNDQLNPTNWAGAGDA